MLINLGSGGSFGIEAINPGNKRSSRFTFTANAPVAPTPSVSGINPPTPTATGSNQQVTVNGSNFVSGLTVDVFNGSGTLIGNLSGTQIQNLSAGSFTMLINLGSGGSFEIGRT